LSALLLLSSRRICNSHHFCD